ncbi:MAG: FtsW/RodA/SpoVE family cell cycle protein, partial [Nocardioides sp.]
FVFSFVTAGVGALYLATTNSERLSRLTTFADPFKDYQGAGWQAAHGILGMSSGGIFGKGISASQQKWGSLPEAHTDFIFAVLGEELGLVGTLLVLALFLTIAYAGIRVAVRTQEPFVRYMAAGITVWLTVQMMINIGMVLALLPVIGLPLPLVSYGGSSLLPELVAMGLLISFARSEPGAAAALRAKRRRRSAAGVTADGGLTRRGR